MVFDGREFAAKIEAGLPKIHTKLVAVLDSTNESGRKYVEIKKKVAGRLGVKLEIELSNGLTADQLGENIKTWNSDLEVGGVVVQLPHPNSDELIAMIDPKKDIDGLREDSPFMPAVVRAVVEILGQSFKDRPYKSVVVVGGDGEIGRRLVENLGAEGMNKKNFAPAKLLEADVVVSATGQAGLIKPEMVKPGVIAIDVGYPRGDFDPGVAQKARFFTPVPGGVGPVTVVMLFANLIDGILGK